MCSGLTDCILVNTEKRVAGNCEYETLTFVIKCNMMQTYFV